MSRPWSKWSVFEYMRHIYMNSGRAPDKAEVQNNFTDMDPTEVQEGMDEFYLTLTIGGQNSVQQKAD